MAVTVRIPSMMRPLTGDAGTVPVDATTVGEALNELIAVHPRVAARLFDEQGRLRRFVNVFVGDEDIRFHRGLDTPTTDGTTVSILPAVSGGAGPGRPHHGPSRRLACPHGAG
jgi:molybdopterin synthase sulfur carrier subunit